MGVALKLPSCEGGEMPKAWGGCSLVFKSKKGSNTKNNHPLASLAALLRRRAVYNLSLSCIHDKRNFCADGTEILEYSDKKCLEIY